MWSIAIMRNRNRCRPSESSRSPQIWRFFVASADFGTIGSSASGGAGSESSSSLIHSAIFSALYRGGWMPRKDRGVNALQPHAQASHQPWHHSAVLYRPSEIRKSPTAVAEVSSDEASSALQSHEILRGFVPMQPPLKDQLIRCCQAIPRMAETSKRF